MVAAIGTAIAILMIGLMVLSLIAVYAAVYAVWLFNIFITVMVFIFPLCAVFHYLIWFFMNKAGLFSRFEGKKKYIFTGIKIYLIFMSVMMLIFFTTSLGYLIFLKFDPSMISQIS